MHQSLFMFSFSTLKQNIKINLDSNYKPLMEENIQNLALKKREIKKTKENTKKKAKKVTQLRLENEKGVLTEKDLNETTYKVKNGLTNKLFIFSQKHMLEKKTLGFRFVEPYFFQYNTFVKARQAGQKLVDFLTAEFQRYPKEYFVKKNRILFPPFFLSLKRESFKKKVGSDKQGKDKVESQSSRSRGRSCGRTTAHTSCSQTRASSC